ncbi:MAG: hypothetical protein ACFFD4_39610, partial [Candidatus Odinarchaeota archaeon]
MKSISSNSKRTGSGGTGKKNPPRSSQGHPLSSGSTVTLEKLLVLLLHFLLQEPENVYTASELAKKITNCLPAIVAAACEQLVKLELIDEKKGFLLFRLLGRNKTPRYYLPRRTVLLAKLVDKRGQQVVFRDKKNQKALVRFVEQGLICNTKDSYWIVPVLVGENRDREYYVNKACSLQVSYHTIPENQVVNKKNRVSIAEKTDSEPLMNVQQPSRKTTKLKVLVEKDAIVGSTGGGDIGIPKIIRNMFGITKSTPFLFKKRNNGSLVLIIQKSPDSN